MSSKPKPHHISLKDQAKSLCGVDLSREWAFFDLLHVQTTPGIPVCPKCLDLAREAENKPPVD